MGAGARITPGACGAVLDGERAKAAQFHTVAAGKRGNNFIEDRVDDVLDVALIEVRVLRGNMLDKL
jgi:hypothetical protein